MLSGIDCAGKTTQLARLKAHLEQRGEHPVVLWFRPGYSAELDAARSLVRRLRPGALPTVANPEARSRTFSKPSVRRTWVAMALLDTWLQCGIKVRVAMARGRTVICDRYLADAALDLELRFPETMPAVRPALRLLEAACPRPEVAVLLMLDHAEMLRRMKLKNEPFPDEPAVRDQRFGAYGAIARQGRYHAVDANQSIDAVHRDIVKLLT